MNTAHSTHRLAARDRLPPLRGLLLTHDCRGRLLSLTDLKKWLRLNVTAFKTEKNDVLVRPGGEQLFEELLPAAGPAGCRLSLRCGPELSPEALPRWRDLGLFDVFLCAYDAEDPGIDAWLAACRALDIPLRLQLTGPRAVHAHAAATAARLRGVVLVNVALHDPFATGAVPAKRRDAGEAVARMNLLVRALRTQDIETYLLHLPFCLVDEDNLPHALNWQQFYLHHQHYGRAAYEWAQKMHRLSAHNVGKAVEMYLARQISFHNLIDQRLLPWVLKQPWLFIRLWMLHKLTRHLNLLRHRPAPLPENVSAAEDAVARLRAAERRTLGPICAACRYQRICSHATEAFRAALPGVSIAAEAGEMVLDPLEMNSAAPRSYDALDAERLHWSEREQQLVEHVWQLTADRPPTREILPGDIEIQDHCTFAMEGGIRWYSFANAELQSTVLARLNAPFTISFTVGGGFAALVGFSFGPHFRIVCPMIAPRHRITFSVDREGHYVLLRDNEPVRPTEFEDSYYLPRKLAGVLEPRISLWNVDGQVVTQTVLLWEEAGEGDARGAVKYSVIIISSCYSRRLQAVLLGLVHQRGISPAELEVIVAYVPGIDATDDLIDSLRRVHPELRIIRAPFPDARRRAKGFMINSCADLAAGEWVVLLDSDIILPPDFFQRLAALPQDCKFAAPDGRRMLTPEQTAAILLGEITPWTCYEALAENGPGEYRHHESMGAPPGFCQCVRRELFREHKYAEFDHFEGADWWFSVELVKRHGRETRFEGMKLLHLDHGGSQWYGTEKQM